MLRNPLLYHEGWGVGRIKHSLTYSGGLSRSYVRTYAAARRYGFWPFSPYMQPDVVEIAEGIPFARLTRYDVPALYALKGQIVRRGVRAIAGIDMPVFPKRRFQHGAVPASALRGRIARPESEYRRIVYDLFTARCAPSLSTGPAASLPSGRAPSLSSGPAPSLPRGPAPSLPRGPAE